MTTTCPQPAGIAMPAGDALLDAEMMAAAHCASVLDEHSVRVAFDDAPDRALAIVVEGPSGEPVRHLGASELLDLLALSPSQQRRWAARPELPISGRDA